MKQSYTMLLIGVVIFLVGLEILLIYIACTSKDVTRNYSEVNKTETTTVSANTMTDSTVTNTLSSDTVVTTQTTESSVTTTTISSTLTSSSENSTDRTIVKPTTQCIISQSTQTTRYATSVTQPLSSKITSPYSTTSAATETTMNRTKTTLVITTPTTSTTLVTNPTIRTMTTSKIPSVTSTVPSFTPPIVTTKIRNTTTAETSVTGKLSTFTITTKTPTLPSIFPPPTMSYPPITITKSSSTSTDRITTEVTTKKNTPCSIVPKFNYVLRNAEKRVACVLTNMTIHINLQYATEDSQVSKLAIAVPVNATTTGVCDEKTANMTLSWEKAAKNQMSSNKNKIIFNYAHDNINFFLDSIFVDVHLNERRIEKSTMDRQLHLFSAAMKHGIFICKAGTTVNVGNMIDVVISDIYLIVFHECSDNIVETETCIVETDVKVKLIAILLITGIIIIGIFIVLFFFYLIWYVHQMKYARRRTSA